MVLDNINNNNHAKINYNDTNDIDASNNIKKYMEHILQTVGILSENTEIIESDIETGLEVAYEMDCSNDEEIAQRLAHEQERINHENPLNRRQRRDISIRIPRVPRTPRTSTTDNVPPAPRPRGRPRRNPLS